jgi:hypothetical protein
MNNTFIRAAAFIVMAGLLLAGCSNPAGGGGVDPKDTFMNNAVAFVGTPQSGGTVSGPSPSVARASRSVPGRSASEIPGGGLPPVSGDFHNETKWHTGNKNDPYAVISLDYFVSARFAVYQITGLQNHLAGLPELLEDANEVVDENDVDDILGDGNTVFKSLLEDFIACEKEEGYIYAVVASAFPYPDSYNLDPKKPEMVSSEDTAEVENAYKTMPMIVYYFLDSENRFFQMTGAYDLIDPAGKTVDYTVIEYTAPDAGEGGFTILHNTPSDIDASFDYLEDESNGWEREDKGTMNAIEIMQEYLEDGEGPEAVGQSVWLGGRTVKVISRDGAILGAFYIERTRPYTYPDWGL